MNELELIEKLSKAISDNISGASVPLDKRPWSAAQCADYLGIEVNTFQRGGIAKQLICYVCTMRSVNFP